MRLTAAISVIALCAAGAAFAQEDGVAATGEPSFFITSVGLGEGGDLGGLAGADAHCAALASAAGLPDRDWRAYLSVAEGPDGQPVNARDRIGAGPWYNVNGDLIAEGLVDLHGQARHFSKETALTETGETVNGWQEDPIRHDILTGSQLDGTPAFDSTGAPLTCRDWTYSGNAGAAGVGHSDRDSSGTRNLASWNAAHSSLDCSQHSLEMAGSIGAFYCFAAD